MRLILCNKMIFKPRTTVNRIVGDPGSRTGVVYSTYGAVEVAEHKAYNDPDWIYISFDTALSIGRVMYCYFYTYKTKYIYTEKGLAQIATKWLNKLY